MRLIIMEKLHCDAQGSSTKTKRRREEEDWEKTQRKRGKQIIYTESSQEDKPKTFATIEAMERDSTDPISSLFFKQIQFL
jgi:hypothetical protein